MIKKMNQKALKQKGLIGAWFHSVRKDGTVNWQGQILARVEPGIYLVQLYEWITGSPSNQQLVKFEFMESWLFYPDNDAMNYSWEYGTARPGTPYNPKEVKQLVVEFKAKSIGGIAVENIEAIPDMPGIVKKTHQEKK